MGWNIASECKDKRRHPYPKRSAKGAIASNANANTFPGLQVVCVITAIGKNIISTLR
jgi:hypothetical protein